MSEHGVEAERVGRLGDDAAFVLEEGGVDLGWAVGEGAEGGDGA